MRSSHDLTSGLISNWERGRRQITPWAYPHLRGLAVTRFACGSFLAVLSVLLLSHSEFGWAAVTLTGSALLFTIASLDAAVARLAPTSRASHSA